MEAVAAAALTSGIAAAAGGHATLEAVASWVRVGRRRL